MLNFWRRGCVLIANIERPAIKLHCTSLVFFSPPLFVLFVVCLHVVFLLLLFLQAFLFCPSLLRGMLFNKFHFMRPVSEQHSLQFADSPSLPRNSIGKDLSAVCVICVSRCKFLNSILLFKRRTQ